MQCKTDDCTNEAVAKVIFPWSAGEGETVACQTHVDAAKQLMANLNRSDELQVLALVAPGVELVTSADAPVAVTPPPAPASPPVTRPTEERLTHQLRAQCLALELDLEKQRGARIAAELELVREARGAFDHVAESIKDFVAAQWPAIVEQIKAAADDEGALDASVVDGRAPGDCDDLTNAPPEAPPAGPATEGPPAQPDQDAPPREP